ncbi:MAG: hypothetical protein JWQ89_2508 [Devosia sp.]|uniref:DUF4396 domain-containing protein n=1 Tax=Devosia sp. TaxID=1871048 RepID=UPI0026281063|nr:DUF4396 domain-containing protein [Devosia sp.]MDB5540781.1 hypothetical protein [Devosia sp.]
MSWLDVLSWTSVALGVLTAVIISIDLIAHPQKMRIMNIVWPVTGLYFPLLGLWFYSAMGRPIAADGPHVKGRAPFWKGVFVSATHCGSGCVVGDILGPLVVFGFGLTLFGTVLFAEYAAEFIFAYVLGIAFQYFPIREMRRVPPARALIDAVKADTLSLVAFEVGMFAWMALAFYVLVPWHPRPDNAVFWFMMQIGMIVGFITAFPANWVLIRWGIKSSM